MRTITRAAHRLIWPLLMLLGSSCFDPKLSTPTAGDYDVRRFGATGDGKHLDSPAIDAAIEACATAGGGTVVLHPGTYLSGTIHLRSHVNLCIDSGATLLGAPQELKAYDPREPFDERAFQDEGHTFFHNSLILGENLTNVSITGRGTINGGGLLAHDNGNIGNKSIALKNCRDVLIRDITIAHGGWFAILVTACDQTTIDNVTIDTNRDGMDIDCCRNVMVSNCRVNSPGDDAICLKSSLAVGWPIVCENVSITNCQVYGFREGSLIDGTWQGYRGKGGQGRIKMGTESNGGFRNVTISNCGFSHCRGLCLEIVDGGVLENVTVSNITMTDSSDTPIFVRLGGRNRGPDEVENGIIRNVLISNVVATGIQKNRGVLILGSPDRDIEGLRLQNIRLGFNGGGTVVDAARNPAEREKDYPEPHYWGPTPTYGLYARHVKNLELANIRIDADDKELRPAIACQDVDGLLIDDLWAKTAGGVIPAWLSNVEHYTIRNSPLLVDIPTTRPSTRPATTQSTTTQPTQ